MDIPIPITPTACATKRSTYPPTTRPDHTQHWTSPPLLSASLSIFSCFITFSTYISTSSSPSSPSRMHDDDAQPRAPHMYLYHHHHNRRLARCQQSSSRASLVA